MQSPSVTMAAPRLGGAARASQYAETGYQVTSASLGWDAVLAAPSAGNSPLGTLKDFFPRTTIPLKPVASRGSYNSIADFQRIK